MVVHCREEFNKFSTDYQSYFDCYPFPLSNFQKWSIYAIINGHHSLITAHTGSGKCLKINTPVMLHDGKIKLVQDIIVGDKLMGDDSTPRNVLGLARGQETMYNITLSNGETFGCNESHILCLKYNIMPWIRTNKNKNIYEVKWFDNENIKLRSKSFNFKNNDKEICLREANELLNKKIRDHKSDFNISVRDYLNLPVQLKRNSLSYKVGVEFPEKQVHIDPYLLGLWLGDGHSNSAAITNQDAPILKYLSNKLPEYNCYLQYRNAYTYGFHTLEKYTQKGRKNLITTILRNYNLLNNKHIPDIYKMNSRENRMKLLAGLIDTDGFYHCTGYEIIQKNKTLAEDIVYLTRSLGFACHIKEVIKSCMYKREKREGTYYRITFFGDNTEDIPVLCKRKMGEKRIIKKSATQYSFTVQCKGMGNYYGFTLDGNHKFLLGNFIVTHNTLPAEFAIKYFKKCGKKVIYTAPIKALCNQKLHDFRLKFPEISFGILTGDIKDNPEADVLIMTTEILRNTLFTKKINDKKYDIPIQFEMDMDTELAAVVFDEVHYIGDQDRGSVWEQAILLLPEHIQLILLSATIEKPEIFAEWLETEKNKENPINQKKKLYMTTTYERVVPLTHYGWISGNVNVIKDAKNTVYEAKVKDLLGKPIKIADTNGNYNEINYHKINDVLKFIQKSKHYVARQHVLNQLIKYLKDNNMLPALCFVFSRKNVEKYAKEITIGLFDKDDTTPSIIEHECEKILISKLKNYREYLDLEEYRSLVSLLKKGIAIHHAGIMPILREMVELLFEKKYIKLLFATETFAVGINMPTKTVIFTGLSKFSGQTMRYILSHEYTQMAGRAGRRGIDTLGHVIHCNNLFEMPYNNEYKHILTGAPKMLSSQFKISYNLILSIICSNQKNLLHTIDNNLISFMEKSFLKTDIVKEINNYDRIQQELEQKIALVRVLIKTCLTPENILKEYYLLKDKLQMVSQKQKKKLSRQLIEMERENGDLRVDIEKYDKLKQLEDDLLKNNSFKRNAINYIQINIDTIINILRDEGFLNEIFNLNEKAMVAMQLQEIHGLAIADLYTEYNGFANLDAIQLASLFSCFTNISIPDDQKMNLPQCVDITIKIMVTKLTDNINKYYEIECNNSLETGTDYTLHYEIIDYIKLWCEASTEIECKKVINTIKSEKEIFLGEFVKAILKINNIALEFEKICESVQNIELLQKVKQIPQLTLKYVATNQSLYI